MGRKTTLKISKKDKPFIQIDSPTGGVLFDINDECPASMEQILDESPFTVNGIKLNIEAFGEKFLIKVAETQIGILNARNSNRIKTCGLKGIKYNGVIIEKNGIFYARFYRNSE